jgi:AcrR family transcriptional regulator
LNIPQNEGKRAQTRRRRSADLRQAGLELFLSKGIEGVTIDDIVQKAGVAKGSFYRYFRDKTELVEALFSEMMTEMGALFQSCAVSLQEATSSEQLQRAYLALAEEMAPLLLREAGCVLLYLQESRAPAIGARVCIGKLSRLIEEHSLRLTEAAHTHGLLRDIPHKLTAYAVIGAIERLAYAFLQGDDLGDLLTLPQMLTSLVLDGLRHPTTAQ